MTEVRDFHHFKGSDLSRSEKIQRIVYEMIIGSELSDNKRENSVVWELMHTAGCCQIGRILAQKRSLDVELAEVICALHDIYAIVEGKYDNHAKQGSGIAAKILKESGGFSAGEIGVITEAIAQHSEKHVHTGKPYAELIKDADAFDCSLYENAKGFYVLHKPKEIFEEYAKRIRGVRKELGLKEADVFR
jgi:uncharacterized protein